MDMNVRDVWNANGRLMGEVVEEKGALTARSWLDLTGPRKNPHQF